MISRALVLLLCSVTCTAAGGLTQKASTVSNPVELPGDVADRFLGGLKIVELPEGKKIVSQTMWPIRFRIGFSTPVFNRYTAVFDGPFSTDVPGVEGYRRVVDIEGRNESGAALTTRFALVLYQDRLDGRWRVISFAKSQDTDEAVAYFRKRLDQDKENPGYNHYILALTLVDAGKLLEAKDAFNKSLALSETEDSSKILSVPKDEVRDYLDAIRSITGDRR